MFKIKVLKITGAQQRIRYSPRSIFEKYKEPHPSRFTFQCSGVLISDLFLNGKQ